MIAATDAFSRRPVDVYGPADLGLFHIRAAVPAGVSHSNLRERPAASTPALVGGAAFSRSLSTSWNRAAEIWTAVVRGEVFAKGGGGLQRIGRQSDKALLYLLTRLAPDLGTPSVAPEAFFCRRAALLRSVIRRRSFGEGQRCSIKGSASRPNSARTSRHQAGHKGAVARKPVQLGNNYSAFRCFGSREGRSQVGSPVKSIGAFAGLRFTELRKDRKGLGRRKSPDSGTLCI